MNLFRFVIYISCFYYPAENYERIFQRVVGTQNVSELPLFLYKVLLLQVLLKLLK